MMKSQTKKLFTAFVFAGVLALYASQSVFAQTGTATTTPTPTGATTVTTTPTPSVTGAVKAETTQTPEGAPKTGYGTMR